MPKITLGCLLALFLAGCPWFVAAQAGEHSQPHIRVAEALRHVRSVNFYFVSRTGDYSYTPEAFKARSSIRIYRACGANCKNFMIDVIDHLREANPRPCSTPGQQNVLITFGPDELIVYSYSGRHILYKGMCYFNDVGVNKVIERPDFIF